MRAYPARVADGRIWVKGAPLRVVTGPRKLVVIGNGMAGMKVVEELLAIAAQGLRHHRVRRRAASQLQPHPALARARRRKELRRHRHQSARLVSRARHHAAHRRSRRRDRPAAARRPLPQRHRSPVRPPAARHGFQADHAAGSRQRPARCRHLPRPAGCRLRCCSPRARIARRWSSAADCWDSKPRTACSSRAWTSRSCTCSTR